QRGGPAQLRGGRRGVAAAVRGARHPAGREPSAPDGRRGAAHRAHPSAHPRAQPHARQVKARDGLRPALLVVAVALAVRLVYLVQLTHTPLDGLVRLDQEYYRTWAVELAAGTWDEHAPYEQGPLYAYLLGALFRVAGVADDLAVRLQLLSGGLVPLLLYAVGRRLGGAGTALTAGLMAATYGPFVFHEGFLMKTFLSPLLLAAVLHPAVPYG